MTYGEWYGLYISLYKRKLAPKTRESYARLHDLLRPLHGVQLAELQPDELQAALIGVELAAGSRQAQLAFALVHAALRRAVRSRHIDRNPADAIDKPEHAAQAGRAISPDDWPRLRPVIDGDAAYALLCYAGLRRGELLALRRADIGRDMIHIDKQRVRCNGQMIDRPPKSAAGVRDVPILPDLAAVLARLPLMLPCALVCSCAPETLARRWRADQLAAGVAQPYRLHDLRHTYATRLVTAGCNLQVLQYMLGHSSFELTANTYTHIGSAQAASECSKLLLH